MVLYIWNYWCIKLTPLKSVFLMEKTPLSTDAEMLGKLRENLLNGKRPPF